MNRVVTALLLLVLLCAPLLAARAVGYYVSGKNIVFLFNGKGAEGKIRTVNVAGSFNNWKPKLKGWRLNKWKKSWVLGIAKSTIKRGKKGASGKYEFKFVVNSTQWIQPPKSSPNKVEDGFNGLNLVIRGKDLR